MRDRERFWTFPERAPWAMRLIQIQFSVVYLIAVWTKVRGTTWNVGTAVSFALRISDLNRFPVPGFVQNSALISNFFTFGTLALELSLAILVWNRKLRPWVLLAGLSLHLGIEYSIRVGFYGLAIMSMYLIWVPPERMDALLLSLRRRLSRSRVAAALRAEPGCLHLARRAQRGSRTCRGRLRRAGWRPSRGRRLRAASNTARAEAQGARSAGEGRSRLRRCRRRPGSRSAARGPRAPSRFARARSSPNPGAKRSICRSIASVMSTVEPLGTWQYAHAVCRPSGAREGSNIVGCASRTNGRSLVSPSLRSPLRTRRSRRACHRGGSCPRRRIPAPPTGSGPTAPSRA